jgi:pyruvate/2-oxoglutarate dehydrogenase complex dihydrolipoamide acyltransferase (E2) component
MTASLQRIAIGGAAVAALLALCACAGDTNPVRDLFVATGVGGEPKPAQEFVAKTRPQSLEYVPVGTSAPERARPPKSAEQVKALEAEMDRDRAAMESQAAAARQLGSSPPPRPAPRRSP